MDDFAVFAAQSARVSEVSDDDTLDLGADVRAMHEAEQSMAMRAFRSLPERWQAVLWHTEVEDESPSEVATLFGLDANGTRVLASRAREGLKQAYLQAHVSATLTDDEECARYADQLGTYARRRLRTRAERGLRKHLEECAKCRLAALQIEEVASGIPAVVPVAVIGWFGAAGYAKAVALIAGGASAGAAGAAGAAAAAGGSSSGGAGAGGAAASEGLGAPVKAGIAAGVVATAAAAAIALALAGSTHTPAKKPEAKPAPSSSPIAKPESTPPTPPKKQPAPEPAVLKPDPTPLRPRRRPRDPLPGRPRARPRSPPRPRSRPQAHPEAHPDPDPDAPTRADDLPGQRALVRRQRRRHHPGDPARRQQLGVAALRRLDRRHALHPRRDRARPLLRHDRPQPPVRLLRRDGRRRRHDAGDRAGLVLGVRRRGPAVAVREISGGDRAVPVHVNLSGRRTVRLVVEPHSSFDKLALADWAESKFTCQ